jgi:hypothetical protein
MAKILMRFAALASLATASALAAAASAPADAADKPRVAFEIVAEPGLPVTAAQAWYQTLTGLGIQGFRIRSGEGEAGIENRGTKESPSYHVTGILTSDNTLHVPGAKFGQRDTAGLRKWLDTLGDRGAERVTQPRAAFGLTPSELVQVQEDLERPVTSSTLGRPALEACGAISARLRVPFVLESGAKQALAEVTINDELKGLSSGTALAAILRPAGLVLEPQRPKGGRLEYHVGRPRAGSEVWPVGWEPKQRASDVLPALYDMLNVEIQETAVAEAVDAVAGRLEVPVLYDRNALALHGADPAGTQADVPAKRMSYSQVLSRVLGQSGLEYKLRVDEADKPFLWITTVKPAP